MHDQKSWAKWLAGKVIVALAGVSVLSLGEPCVARLARLEDAHIITKMDHTIIKIAPNCGSTVVQSQELQIVTEKGRGDFSAIRIVSNKDNEKLTVECAERIPAGKTTPIPIKPDQVETKPLASDNQGFDQMQQTIISMPDVQVGDRVLLTVRLETKEPSFSGVFSRRIFLCDNHYTEKSTYEISAPFRLFMHINDPHKILKVEKKGGSDKSTIHISLKKPGWWNHEVNEPSNAVVNPKAQTWVLVTNKASWDELAQHIVPCYEAVASQPLPKAFQAIVNRAKRIQDPVDQINSVSSQMQDMVQYMGDWRSVAGRYCPRPLKTIAERNAGDCKDLSIMTVAMLRALGYQAWPMLVYSDPVGRTSDTPLPDSTQFNHVITRATHASGRTFWIEATSPISMAGPILSHIEGRKGLLLHPEKPIFEPIPASNPQQNGWSTQRKIHFDGGRMYTQGANNVRGEEALSLSTKIFFTPPSVLQEKLQNTLLDRFPEPGDTVKVVLPKPSRIAQPSIRIPFEVVKTNAFKQTHAGPMLPWENSWAGDFTCTAKDQIGDLFIGPRRKVTHARIFKGIALINPERLNLDINTPWVHITQRARHVGKDTHLTQDILVKTRFIPVDQLETIQFQRLKRLLDTRIRDNALILPDSVGVEGADLP
jgi:hypothetical protein